MNQRRRRIQARHRRAREQVQAVLRGECPLHGALSLVHFGSGVFCVSCIDGIYYRRVSGAGTQPVYRGPGGEILGGK